MRRLMSLLSGVAVVLGPALAAGPATAGTYNVRSCANHPGQPISSGADGPGVAPGTSDLVTIRVR